MLQLSRTEEAFENNVICGFRWGNPGLNHLPQDVERTGGVLDAAPSVGEGVVRDRVRGEPPLEGTDEGGGLAGVPRLDEGVEEGVEEREVLRDAVGAVEREEEPDGEVGAALRHRKPLEQDRERARGEGEPVAREEREDGARELARVAQARSEVEREIDGARGELARAWREAEQGVEEEQGAWSVVPQELEDGVGHGGRDRERGCGRGGEGRRERPRRRGGQRGGRVVQD